MTVARHHLGLTLGGVRGPRGLVFISCDGATLTVWKSHREGTCCPCPWPLQFIHSVALLSFCPMYMSLTPGLGESGGVEYMKAGVVGQREISEALSTDRGMSPSRRERPSPEHPAQR